MKGKIFLFVTLTLVIVLVIGAFVILKNPQLTESQIDKSLCEISKQNIFGCDSLGRDLFFRSVVGLLNTLFLGVFSLTIAMLIGLVFGFLLAVYDNKIINAIFEYLNNIPPFILISLFMLYFRMIEMSMTFQIICFVILLACTHFFIIARAVEFKVKEELSKEYFVAAQSIALSNIKIYKNHIFPNIVNHFLIISATQLTTFFLFESTLSFLGIGLQPPMITMGLIFQDGWRHFSEYPHLLLGPVVLFSFMLLLIRSVILEFKEN